MTQYLDLLLDALGILHGLLVRLDLLLQRALGATRVDAHLAKPRLSLKLPNVKLYIKC